MSEDTGAPATSDAATVWHADGDRPDASPGPSARRRSGSRRRRRRRSQRILELRRRAGQRSGAVRLVVLSLLVIAGVGGTFLARDVVAVREHLDEARAGLLATQQAVADGDPDLAESHAQVARGAATAAAARSDGPLWAVAGVLPYAGSNVNAVQSLTAIATSTTTIVRDGLDLAVALISDEASVMAGAQQVDLASLVDLQDTLGGIDSDPLRSAVADASATSPRWLLPILQDARTEGITEGTRVLDALDHATSAASILPAFFGADGDRSYLVLLQTPAELRGTGGLSTYLSALDARDGRLSVQGVERLNTFLQPDDSGSLSAPSGGLVEVEAPEDYAMRYDHLLARGYIGNANVDPDLPTVGPVLLDIAQEQTGQVYDGAILLDPVALQQILQGGPPLDIPEAVNKAPLPDPIPIDRLAQILLIDQYDVVNGVPAERRAYLDAVSEAALRRLFADSLDVRRLLLGFGDAIATRHLQLFSRDEDEQAFFASIDAAGQMTSAADGTDVLAVTGNNAAADKKDVHVGHRLTGTLTLDDLRAVATDDADESPEVLATRAGTIEVEMVNPLGSTGHDTYILGSSEPQQRGSPPPVRLDVGPARTWFTVWTPVGTEASQLTVDGERQLFGNGTIHGHRAFDYFLEVPMESTRSFEIDLSGPVGLAWDGDELVYTLTLWRQAKGIPDVWDLTITGTDGWTPSSVELEGGGAPTTGFGAIDDAPPVSATIDGADVRVQGGVTQDLTIEIRLQRA